MEFKGTKGSWEIDKYNSISSNGKQIISSSGIGTTAHQDIETVSNAKLIAAAPELLEEHLIDLQYLKTWSKQLIDAGLRGSIMFQEYQDMIKAKEAVIEKALK